MSLNSMSSNGTPKTACLDKPMVGKYKINTGTGPEKGTTHILSILEGSKPSRWLRRYRINTNIFNAMDMNRQGLMGRRLNALRAIVQTVQCRTSTLVAWTRHTEINCHTGPITPLTVRVTHRNEAVKLVSTPEYGLLSHQSFPNEC